MSGTTGGRDAGRPRRHSYEPDVSQPNRGKLPCVITEYRPRGHQPRERQQPHNVRVFYEVIISMVRSTLLVMSVPYLQRSSRPTSDGATAGNPCPWETGSSMSSVDATAGR